MHCVHVGLGSALGVPRLPSPSYLEVQLVEGGWQMLGHVAQEVAGQNKDLNVAGTIEHVVWQPGVRQLVVVQVHGPEGCGAGTHSPGTLSPGARSPGASKPCSGWAWGLRHPPLLQGTSDST